LAQRLATRPEPLEQRDKAFPLVQFNAVLMGEVGSSFA
jgi:hypothetical protein